MEELINKLFDELGCKHSITKEFLKVLLEATKKFDYKQDIYETENISNTGEIGILTRIGDSYYEIKKYLQIGEDKRSELQLSEGKIMKDFQNIGIYGIIGYLYMIKVWK